MIKKLRITNAYKDVSQRGNDMLVIDFDTVDERIRHYLVFMPDRPELTTRLFDEFMASFPEITNYDTSTWKGYQGAGEIADNRVQYFIPADEQAGLEPVPEPIILKPGNAQGWYDAIAQEARKS